jgi:hypothetical protein
MYYPIKPSTRIKYQGTETNNQHKKVRYQRVLVNQLSPDTNRDNDYSSILPVRVNGTSADFKYHPRFRSD